MVTIIAIMQYPQDYDAEELYNLKNDPNERKDLVSNWINQDITYCEVTFVVEAKAQHKAEKSSEEEASTLIKEWDGAGLLSC